jgi:hypothetical protein
MGKDDQVHITDFVIIPKNVPVNSDMLGKRLVVLGVSSATGMYTIFMAKARGGVEGVAKLLGAECGLCHQY